MLSIGRATGWTALSPKSAIQRHKVLTWGSILGSSHGEGCKIRGFVIEDAADFGLLCIEMVDALVRRMDL